MLGILAFAEGVHPLTAYLELCRLVGQLAIFGADPAAARPAALRPRRPGRLLLPGQAAHRRPAGHPGRARVQGAPVRRRRPADAGGAGAGLARIGLADVHRRPEPARPRGVHPAADQARPARHEGRQLRAGRRDLPDGPGRPAVRPQPAAPRGPCRRLPGLIYFQVSRESQQGEWQNVQKSLTLAIRLNENLIAGNIQGQRVLTIKTGGSRRPRSSSRSTSCPSNIDGSRRDA